MSEELKLPPPMARDITLSACGFSSDRVYMTWSRPGMMRIEIGLWPGLDEWKHSVKCHVKEALSHHAGGSSYEILVLTSEEFEHRA